MYDLVAYDRKHNEANGHANRDGAGDNRSWNCGFEGDDGAPAEVLALRRRQLRNAWCLLAMSLGTPMVAMGDEFGRTQHGNNNAYNQDNPISWVDWTRERLPTWSASSAACWLCATATRAGPGDVVGRRRALVRDHGTARHR